MSSAIDTLHSILGTSEILSPKYDSEDQHEPFFGEFSSPQEARYASSLSRTVPATTNSRAQLQACNDAIDILEPLKTYMEGFQQHLDTITKSSLLPRDGNSSGGDSEFSKMGNLVSDLALDLGSINTILNGPINEEFCTSLQYICEKRERYTELEYVPSDLQEVMDLVSVKALERCKSFIVHKIKQLRRFIPSQRLQQEMISVKFVYKYIVDNNLQLADELFEAYANTMTWYYDKYFARYARSLTILSVNEIDKSHHLGTADAASGLSYFYSSSVTNTDTTWLNMRPVPPAVMVSQIAETMPIQVGIEVPFVSYNRCALDNLEVENRFQDEFFRARKDVFTKVYDHGLALFESYLTPSYDVIGVLLCIKYFQELNDETTEGPYWDSVRQLIWPKFQQLVDYNCESLHKSRFSKEDGVHWVTKQVTKFLLALTHAQVDMAIVKLRHEFEVVLNRITRNEEWLAKQYEYVVSKLDECPTRDHFMTLEEAYSKR